VLQWQWYDQHGLALGLRIPRGTADIGRMGWAGPFAADRPVHELHMLEHIVRTGRMLREH
jgi:hypothetical protein